MIVYPAKCNRFHKGFHTASEGISKGLSTIQADASYGNWSEWDAFCRDVALDPLLVLYRYSFPILDAFSRQYRTR